MATIENQPIKTKREELKELMRTMYPDRAFGPTNGVDGEGGEGGEELESAILETLDELVRTRDEGRAKNAALNKLLFGDPRAAEFVNLWVETGDPFSAIATIFGDEVDLKSEEGRTKYKNELSAFSAKRESDAKLNQEAEANWNASLEALDSWGNSKNLSEEDKVNIMLRLVGITANGLVNKYEDADFDMAYKANTYDKAVGDARHEGEVTGRNARIDENKRARQAMQAMPPALSGQGMQVKPKPKNDSPWAGIK